ncbi:MAG TPA: hypothetical protein VJI46_05130 [Candidatus Nanoarchaeia archaeon]|nr:hypothetical protein [Candidatus Nanoarchaeia archaeon]
MASASEIKNGSYIIYDNEPYRVLSREVTVFGTHSHSKLRVTLQNLYTKTEKVINLAHQDRVEILDITRKSGSVISKNKDAYQIMDSVSFLTLDAEKIPSVQDEINIGDEITFVELPDGIKIIDRR